MGLALEQFFLVPLKLFLLQNFSLVLSAFSPKLDVRDGCRWLHFSVNSCYKVVFDMCFIADFMAAVNRL